MIRSRPSDAPGDISRIRSAPSLDVDVCAMAARARARFAAMKWGTGGDSGGDTGWEQQAVGGNQRCFLSAKSFSQAAGCRTLWALSSGSPWNMETPEGDLIRRSLATAIARFMKVRLPTTHVSKRGGTAHPVAHPICTTTVHPRLPTTINLIGFKPNQLRILHYKNQVNHFLNGRTEA